MIGAAELSALTDVDFRKINPYASDFDQKVEMANQAVVAWMKVKDNYDYLQEKKADYIHNKGWTNNNGKRGNLKHEVDIPQEAFILLPPEIRNDRDRLMRWAETHHPYLFHKRM